MQNHVLLFQSFVLSLYIKAEIRKHWASATGWKGSSVNETLKIVNNKKGLESRNVIDSDFPTICNYSCTNRQMGFLMWFHLWKCFWIFHVLLLVFAIGSITLCLLNPFLSRWSTKSLKPVNPKKEMLCHVYFWFSL